MTNYSDNTKEKAFIDWFNKQFNVEKWQFIHQNTPFTFNKHHLIISNNNDDTIEVIFTDTWNSETLNCYLQQPIISLKLSSKRLDNITNLESKEKLDAMMAAIDIANICNQYISNL